MNLLKKFVVRMAAAVGVMAIGVFLNIATVLANHGFMPVFMPGCPENFILDSRHICAGPHSHFFPFIDIFYFHGWIWSLGDFIIMAGQILGLISVLLMAASCIAYYVRRKAA